MANETGWPPSERIRRASKISWLVKGAVSAAEWQTRCDLAACYRLMDCYGMTDLIYNHITARIPGTDHLLINLYGLLYREITASSLVKIDVEGNIIAKPDTDYGINKSGYVIHGAIHKARSDVACIIHTHTRAGMAVAAMKCGLLPMSQTSIRFAEAPEPGDELDRLLKGFVERFGSPPINNAGPGLSSHYRRRPARSAGSWSV